MDFSVISERLRDLHFYWYSLAEAYGISEFNPSSAEQKSINLLRLITDLKSYVESAPDCLIKTHVEWSIVRIIRKICESQYCSEQVIEVVWEFQQYLRNLIVPDYFDQGRFEYIADRMCVFVAKSRVVPKHILAILLDSECHEARKEAQRNPLMENFVAFK